MGYSTKEMHVAFMAASKDKAFKDNFTPLAQSSVQKLISASH